MSIWEQKQGKIVEAIERTRNKAFKILNFKGPRELVRNLHHNKS